MSYTLLNLNVLWQRYMITNNAYIQHQLVYSYYILNKKPYGQLNLKI